MHSITEQVLNVLIDLGNDDPNFIDVMANTEVDETADTVDTIESLLQDFNELLSKFDELI